jgi:uncharacterized protein YecT (DUF1311 family)
MEKMTMSKVALFLATLILASASADAQPGPCGDKQTQSGMTECAARQLTGADTALNNAYAILVKRLKSDPAALAVLRESESAWLNYRRKQCDLESYRSTGGSIQPMITHQCWRGLTEDRTKFLQGQLHCEDGDLTCLKPQFRRQ